MKCGVMIDIMNLRRGVVIKTYSDNLVLIPIMSLELLSNLFGLFTSTTFISGLLAALSSAISNNDFEVSSAFSNHSFFIVSIFSSLVNKAWLTSMFVISIFPVANTKVSVWPLLIALGTTALKLTFGTEQYDVRQFLI